MISNAQCSTSGIAAKDGIVTGARIYSERPLVCRCKAQEVQKTSGGGVRAWVHVFISMGDHRPGSTKFHQGELAEVP